MDFRKKFIVEPHVKFKLGNIDPSYKGTHESHESAAAGIEMSALCQKQTFHHSFDHLIGAGEQRRYYDMDSSIKPRPLKDATTSFARAIRSLS